MVFRGRNRKNDAELFLTIAVLFFFGIFYIAYMDVRIWLIEL